ncbi:MAG: hypothetical protein HKN04_09405 [Rhodothermaceae bacterium]|nr:hypothetical protein [Rhodothermaceae bacterium]
MRASAVMVLASSLLVACSGSNGDEAPMPEPDSLLVEALVTLQLAEARAALMEENRDSLRAEAYAHVTRSTALDSVTIAEAVDRAAQTPEAAALLYQRVADRLAAEQRGD